MPSIPIRLQVLQEACHLLPPLIAQRIRNLLFPHRKALKYQYYFSMKSLGGSVFEGSMKDFHAYPFAFHGYYDWRVLVIARTVCSPGDSVIEIGANIGTETIGFRDVVGEKGYVYAFEPLASNVKALRKLVRINGWNNVHIFPVAVGEKAGEVHFSAPKSDWMSGVGHVVRREGGKIQDFSFTVQQVALDDLAERFRRPVRAMFIDVEGYEIFVLRGARNIISEDRPLIVMEASPKLLKRAGTSLEEVQYLLEKWQYSIWRITRFGLSDILRIQKASNWLCVPKDSMGLVRKARRNILLGGLLPCVKKLNPLCG